MTDEKPADGRTIHPLTISVLALVTLGLYWFFWLYRRYAELGRAGVGATEVSPGRAVGFLFIPLFNIYWVGFIAYDLARGLGRLQSARLQRPLFWPYTVTILLVGGVLLSSILQFLVVGALFWFVPSDGLMRLALAASLGAVLALPAWSAMILTQLSLNRVWSGAESPRTERLRLFGSLACLVVLVSLLTPLAYAAVRLARAPSTALRFGVAWAEETGRPATEAEVAATISNLRKRLDRLASLGLGEPPAVERSDAPSEAIEVSLPPLEPTGLDWPILSDALTTEHHMELRAVLAGPVPSEDALREAMSAEGVADQVETLWDNVGQQAYGCGSQVVLTGADIENVAVGTDTLGGSAVTVRLTEQGGATMRGWSEANLGRPLAIVVDGHVVSAPTIQSVMGRDLQITGQFSLAEVESLTRLLRASGMTFPRPIRLVHDETVHDSRWVLRRTVHFGAWMAALLLVGAVFYRIGRSVRAVPIP